MRSDCAVASFLSMTDWNKAPKIAGEMTDQSKAQASRTPLAHGCVERRHAEAFAEQIAIYIRKLLKVVI